MGDYGVLRRIWKFQGVSWEVLEIYSDVSKIWNLVSVFYRSIDKSRLIYSCHFDPRVIFSEPAVG